MLEKKRVHAVKLLRFWCVEESAAESLKEYVAGISCLLGFETAILVKFLSSLLNRYHADCFPREDGHIITLTKCLYIIYKSPYIYVNTCQSCLCLYNIHMYVFHVCILISMYSKYILICIHTLICILGWHTWSRDSSITFTYTLCMEVVSRNWRHT